MNEQTSFPPGLCRSITPPVAAPYRVAATGGVLLTQKNTDRRANDGR
jgi:hypothetical protein